MSKNKHICQNLNCSKEFLHTNSANKYCCLRCSTIQNNKNKIENTKIKNKEKEQNYYKNPNFCKNCKSILKYSPNWKTTFCSIKCSAIYYNEQKYPENARYKPSYKRKKSMTKEDYLKNPKKCKNCDKEITFDNKHKKSCSPECKTLLLIKSGKKSAKNRCKRSKNEITLYNLCINHFTNVTHNIPIIDGWDADIILNEQKIAILWNGPWHYKDMKMTNHSLLQVQTRDKIKINVLTKAGWKVIVFEDRYYTPKSAFEELKKIGAPTGSLLPDPLLGRQT